MRIVFGGFHLSDLAGRCCFLVFLSVFSVGYSVLVVVLYSG